MNIFRFVIPKSLVEYITVDSTVRQALEKMRFHRYTAIPVIDGEGKYLGTVHNDDLFRYFLENGNFETRGAEKDPISLILDPTYNKPLSHTDSMLTLIDRVKEHNFVPVVDDRGCFIGIILRRDVLNYLSQFYPGDEEPESEKIITDRAQPMGGTNT